jgi:hypothetical protein
LSCNTRVYLESEKQISDFERLYCSEVVVSSEGAGGGFFGGRGGGGLYVVFFGGRGGGSFLKLGVF